MIRSWALKEVKDGADDLRKVIALETGNWEDIYVFLKLGERKIIHDRNTNETKIHVELNLDGSGQSDIHTGLGFLIICWTRFAGMERWTLRSKQLEISI
jgi:hypothetical protein